MAHTEITVNNTDKDSLEYYGIFVSFVILENFGNGDSHGFDVRAPTGLCTPWASVRLSRPRTSPYRADGRVLCQGPIQVVSAAWCFFWSPKKLSWSGLCCLVLHGHFAKGTWRVLPGTFCRLVLTWSG